MHGTVIDLSRDWTWHQVGGWPTSSNNCRRSISSAAVNLRPPKKTQNSQNRSEGCRGATMRRLFRTHRSFFGGHVAHRAASRSAEIPAGGKAPPGGITSPQLPCGGELPPTSSELSGCMKSDSSFTWLTPNRATSCSSDMLASAKPGTDCGCALVPQPAKRHSPIRRIVEVDMRLPALP